MRRLVEVFENKPRASCLGKIPAQSRWSLYSRLLKSRKTRTLHSELMITLRFNALHKHKL